MTKGDNRNAVSMKHEANRSQRQEYWDTVMGTSTKPKTTSTSSSKQHLPSTSTSKQDISQLLNKTPHHPSNGYQENTSTAGRSSLTNVQSSTSSHSAQDHSTNVKKARPFQCDLCKSCYTQKGDMVRHIRYVHEGLRPFQCRLCGNSFGRRSVLNKHIKIHEKEWLCRFSSRLLPSSLS